MTIRCSGLGCWDTRHPTDRCPARNDCPRCACCTAKVCEDKTWQDPNTPQLMVAAFNITCPCERRG
jgi:hypothetical protein